MSSIERISHYRIVTLLGRGAMGEVYQAIDERLGRAVALKLLPTSASDSTDSQARLLREAQAASSLNHRGIVTVHDVGAWEGRVFMVMELVDGTRFSDVASEGIDMLEALSLCAEVADALAVAHARSILHRDIKSDNIMRTREGHAKVLDFGVAKLVDSLQAAETDVRTGPSPRIESQDALAATVAPTEGTLPSQPGERIAVAAQLESSERERTPFPADSRGATHTVVGSLVGTPAYMAPEQAAGSPVDARSEIFSLGVVLYELLTGVLLFDRSSIEATLMAVHDEPISPPSRKAPTRKLPALVDRVTMHALERDPTRRYADMAAFAAALRDTRARLISARSSTLRKVALIGGGVALFVAALYGYRVATRPQPRIVSARRLTFERGCEELPSFAPDGRTLVYDGLVDGDYELFSLDLVSGARTRLTTIAGWDWAASYSPDGRWLAWQHAGEDGSELTVSEVGGPRRQLGPIVNTPGWTPDGAILASADGTTIERVDIRSGARTAFGTLDPGEVLHAIKSFADGTALGTWDHTSTELAIGTIDHGRTQRVVEHMTSEPTGVAVAPSQHAFYYTRHGGNTHELIRRGRDGGEIIVPGGSSPVSIALSPDGKQLAYSTCIETQSIARVDADGKLVEFIGSGSTRDDHPRAVDDDRVVFSSDRAGPSQVWLHDRRGELYRPLTAADTYMPAVSRDGTWLAYVDRKQGGVFVMPLAGGEARRLSSEPGDTDPVFTHDGKSVIFERHSHGSQIWAAPVGGGAAHAISGIGGTAPAASPTDDLVLYLQSDRGKTALMSATVEGSAPHALAITLPSGKLNALTFAPDGKRVALARNVVEIVELPLDGGNATTRWHATIEGVQSFAYDATGSLMLSLTRWDGDLWLADGDFP